MNNLIKNAIWRSGQSNDPQFFLNTAPISFDQFEINGYRYLQHYDAECF